MADNAPLITISNDESERLMRLIVSMLQRDGRFHITLKKGQTVQRIDAAARGGALRDVIVEIK